jgi:hypothetical protein
MADVFRITHYFFGGHLPSEEIHDITTSRVPQARVHQVGDSDGMVVLRLVPSQDCRNVGIGLDSDTALASRPLARPLSTPVDALPDIFSFTTGSLARTRISSFLVP